MSEPTSDTPRTDAYFASDWHPGLPTIIDFARELEREPRDWSEQVVMRKAREALGIISP